MKFVCERCQTKYSIADEKVRQKILKIRCKTCENVITVREQMPGASAEAGPAPTPPPPPSPPAGAKGRPAEWHLAVNGTEEGPFELGALAKKIHEAKGDDEVYVWRADFDGWKAPKDVPAVAAELALLPPKAPVRPAPPAPGRGVGAGATALGAGRTTSSSLRADSGGGGAGKSLPPPSGGSIGRGTIPPGRGGSPSGVMPAVRASARPSASAMPVATAPALATAHKAFEDEDERTQIQALDASLLVDGGKKSTAPTTAATSGPGNGPGPLAREGAATASSPGRPVPTGFEALDQLTVTGAPTGALGAGGAAPKPFFPPPTGAPAQGGSQLSQLKGLPGFFSRHAGLKYVAAGGVLLAAVIAVVVVSFTKDGSKRTAPRDEIAEAPKPQRDVDPEQAARAEANKWFRSNQPPETASVSVPRAGRQEPPRRPAPKPTPKAAAAAPATAPPPLQATEPPPASSAPSGRTAIEERRVAIAQPKPGASGAARPPSGDVDFGAVVRRKEHQAALKLCYERGLKRNNQLRIGKMYVNVDVGMSGVVKKVDIDAPVEFDTVTSCITEAVRRWRFPANDAEYSGSFPVVFQGG
jgi:predicted Zn finger-like uncharacterized protein